MRKANLYAVILAGGSGTRFWPLSRESKPKQFLNIIGQETLFQETLKRIQSKVKGSNVFIVTNAAYRKDIKKQVSRFKIPQANILLEPQGKNTAPAICWAAAKIHKINPQAVMAVLPSDHLILNREKFLKVLMEAVRLAKENYLVTFGIVPTRPETGYGYLKTAKTKVRGKQVVRVEQFTEKPSLSKAKRLVKQKNYFWNSGMFVWKTSTILDAFNEFLPNVYELLVQIEHCSVRTGQDYINNIWGEMPSISIDYGILEKAKNVLAVPALGIDWSDLGSWESLTEVLTKDKSGNIIKGDVISVHCKNTLVWGQKKMIASIGLQDIIIIDTPDALLVCRKELSQKVKEIVSTLKRNKRIEV